MTKRKPIPNPTIDFNAEVSKLLSETEEHHMSSEMVLHLTYGGETYFMRFMLEEGKHPLHIGRIPTYKFPKKKTIKDYTAHKELYNRMKKSKQLEGMEDVADKQFR